jgi:hypothetical protein
MEGTEQIVSRVLDCNWRSVILEVHYPDRALLSASTAAIGVVGEATTLVARWSAEANNRSPILSNSDVV